MFIPLYCRGRYYPSSLYTSLGKVCLSLYTAGINMANLIRLEYLTSALCTWNIPWNLLHNSYKPMLLILDGNSEKSEHVWSEICNLTFVYSESSYKFEIFYRIDLYKWTTRFKHPSNLSINIMIRSSICNTE